MPKKTKEKLLPVTNSDGDVIGKIYINEDLLQDIADNKIESIELGLILSRKNGRVIIKEAKVLKNNERQPADIASGNDLNEAIEEIYKQFDKHRISLRDLSIEQEDQDFVDIDTLVGPPLRCPTGGSSNYTINITATAST